MSYLKSFNLFALSLMCGVFASSFLGCGGGEKSSSSKEVSASQSDNNAPSTNADTSLVTVKESSDQGPKEVKHANPDVAKVNPKENFSPELKGVWYGESVYDVDAYSARVAQLSPEDAAKLQQVVSTFATIVMAAEFRADSVVELDMMITTQDGQQLRDRSVGTWNVVAKTEHGIKVETSEYKNENQQPTKKLYDYQFIDKDHFQFVPDSVSADLREFSPRIVFQRLDQPLDEASVAEENSSNVVR